MEHVFLHTSLNRISPLSSSAWHALEKLIIVRNAGSGEHLLRAGEPATHACFLNRGLLREYYLDSDGHEFTRRFCDAGDFSGSLADLLVERGSLVSIQALEASEVLTWQWHDIEAIAEREPSVAKLLRRSAEALYVRKIEREFEMLTMSAAQRYLRCVESQPAIQSRLPRHMIASYLGITAVHLSRIANAARSRPRQARQTGRKRSG